MTIGANGLASVSRSGRPRRWPMPRLSVSNSSWQAFSTLRRMFPVSTDSSIAEVSINVRFAASTLEKSALAEGSPEMSLSTSARRRRSNSAMISVRSLPSERLASSSVDVSSRTSDRLARAISMSPTRSSIDANDSTSRWTARSRQSDRIFADSRACGRRVSTATEAAGKSGRLEMAGSVTVWRCRAVPVPSNAGTPRKGTASLRPAVVHLTAFRPHAPTLQPREIGKPSMTGHFLPL